MLFFIHFEMKSIEFYDLEWMKWDCIHGNKRIVNKLPHSIYAGVLGKNGNFQKPITGFETFHAVKQLNLGTYNQTCPWCRLKETQFFSNEF